MGAPIDAFFAQAERLSQAAGHGRTFLVLSGSLAGQSFTGSMHTQTMVDPSSELGADPRESWMLEVIAPGPALARTDRIRENDGTVWEIAALPQPAYITKVYEVIKIESIDT